MPGTTEIEFIRITIQPLFRARLSANFTVATGTWTTVLFDVVYGNLSNQYDPASGIFTADFPGQILGVMGTTWYTIADNFAYHMALSINNVTASGDSCDRGYFKTPVGVIGNLDTIHLGLIYDVVPGDTLRVKAYHDRGINQFITGSYLAWNSYSNFSVYKIN